MYIVDTLKVERLVNEAKCPTRVELSVANKNQGLREGFKWLVKSIIAHLPELGPRVELDVEEERLKEDIRRAEVRKRMEERRRRQNDEIQEEEEDIPGFVPIDQYNSVSRKAPKPPPQPTIPQNDDTEDEIEGTDTSSSPNPTIRVCSSGIEYHKTPSPVPHPTPSQGSISNASPSNPSPPPPLPPPQPVPIGPPPQPGPVGPPPQPAPGGISELKLFSPRSHQPMQPNGAINILPASTSLQDDIAILPKQENIIVVDYSPRTPLPPAESTRPSPFLQMPIDAEELSERLSNTDISTNQLLEIKDVECDVLGKESTNSDEGVNFNSNQGNSESSSVFESKRDSLTGSITSLGGHLVRNSSASSCGTRKLQLEPLSREKTKSVLKKVINNNYKATTNAYSKTNTKSSSSSGDDSKSSSNVGSRSGSAYRHRRSSIVFKPIVNW